MTTTRAVSRNLTEGLLLTLRLFLVELNFNHGYEKWQPAKPCRRLLLQWAH